jgi:hypothetical protein
MPLTPNGTQTAYATPQDLIYRLDVNALGQLTRDDGGQNSATQLLTDPYTAKALLEATGIVESVTVGSDRYQPADFAALIAYGGASAELLKGIVCGLTLPILRWRRGIMESSKHPLTEWAEMMLEKIHLGQEIFAFVESEKAGLPTTVPITPDDLYNGTPTMWTNNNRYWPMLPNRRGSSGGGRGGWNRC